jgi:uncharacterized protein (DUF1800 family)
MKTTPRELLQLFTFGLYELNIVGSLRLAGGSPIETYTPDDINELVRVSTFDSTDGTTLDRYHRPMILAPSQHETDIKTFLGKTIPIDTNGVDSKTMALDPVFAHPNVAPFVSKQLIQRLVTSNPSLAYVGRVAALFTNNGTGVRSDMKAVIRAVLRDSEARCDAGTLASTTFGKVHDPVLRLTGWARAHGATSPGKAWAIGDNSTATRLAQSPGRSGSVFGFFRLSYTPPNTAIAEAGLVASELQLANETTVIGYVNSMEMLISVGIGDINGNYTDLLAKAATSQALVDDINLNLAAGQLSVATRAQIITAVGNISALSSIDLLNRVHTALLLTMASPDYLVQK